MVKEILTIGHALSYDSADALALALCHAHSERYDRRKIVQCLSSFLICLYLVFGSHHRTFFLSVA